MVELIRTPYSRAAQWHFYIQSSRMGSIGREKKKPPKKKPVSSQWLAASLHFRSPLLPGDVETLDVVFKSPTLLFGRLRRIFACDSHSISLCRCPAARSAPSMHVKADGQLTARELLRLHGPDRPAGCRPCMQAGYQTRDARGTDGQLFKSINTISPAFLPRMKYLPRREIVGKHWI